MDPRRTAEPARLLRPHQAERVRLLPKDDPYLRERWRDAYPDARLDRLRELVDRAGADHVRFTYALSPGLSVCYSSADDITALVRKFASLYDIGVRSFAIPLDDISYTKWNCAADQEEFGSGAARPVPRRRVC
ncbi:beta-N-acetylglucosaminidase domain-containing protein [Streptomyces stelliscabiei]